MNDQKQVDQLFIEQEDTKKNASDLLKDLTRRITELERNFEQFKDITVDKYDLFNERLTALERNEEGKVKLNRKGHDANKMALIEKEMTETFAKLKKAMLYLRETQEKFADNPDLLRFYEPSAKVIVRHYAKEVERVLFKIAALL